MNCVGSNALVCVTNSAGARSQGRVERAALHALLKVEPDILWLARSARRLGLVAPPLARALLAELPAPRGLERVDLLLQLVDFLQAPGM